MRDRSQGGERARRRGFRPTMDGTLEDRCLLSRASLVARAAGGSNKIQAQVARGGQVSLIRDTDGELYNVSVLGGGKVRAQAMSGGRVRLTIDRSNPATVVAINAVNPPVRRGSAHTYPASAGGDRLLHVGAIRITSGKINQILGYRTTDLSGPITVSNPATVSRIAVFRLTPGASISTAGDLDTLDVYSDATLSGGPGLDIGRDLNYLNVGGNIDLIAGSSFIVGRDIGLSLQPPKGTDPGGAGGIVRGNFNINPGSRFVITRGLRAPLVIQGDLNGASDITLGEDLTASNFIVVGDVTF